MDVIGTVVRLQVQRSRLKPGEKPHRVYDPAPLLEVDALDVGPRGVTGPGGLLDVHHADHPETRNVKLSNNLSVLPRGHYLRMRELFGPHLVDGIAGESLLLDTDEVLPSLEGPLALEAEDGLLELPEVAPIPPCVEFSRFAVRRPVGDTGPEVRAAMAALADGMRGFYLRGAGTGRITAGCRLFRP